MIKKKEAPVVCTRWFCSSHSAISGKVLEQSDKTGEETFDDFLEDTSLREKCVISGLQYFHKCASVVADDSADSTLARQLMSRGHQQHYTGVYSVPSRAAAYHRVSKGLRILDDGTRRNGERVRYLRVPT